MAKLLLLCSAGVFSSLLLGGCRPPATPSFSSDGQRIAVAGAFGVRVAPSDGGREIWLSRRSGSDAVFSPHGDTLVFYEEHRKTATVANGSTGTTLFRVAGVMPPFAWRPDGTEFVGMSEGDVARVVHLPSKGVVREYRLPFAPQYAAWAPDGRDLAFTWFRGLAVVHEGSVKSVDSEGVLGGPIWCAGTLLFVSHSDRRAEWPSGDVTVMSFDLNHLSARAVSTPISLVGLGSPDRFALDSVSLSPEGQRLAIVTVEDHSATHALRRMLQEGPNGPRHADLDREMKIAEGCTVVDLRNGATTFFPGFEGPGVGLSWSRDGKKIAIAGEDKVVVYNAPPGPERSP